MNVSSKTYKLKTLRGKGAIIHSKDVEFMNDSRDPRTINPVMFEYNMADTRVWAENEDSSKSVSLESILGQCPFTNKGPFLTDKDLKEKLLVYVQVADDDVIHPDETINDLCARFDKSREYLTELALEEEHRAIGKGVANTIRLKSSDGEPKVQPQPDIPTPIPPRENVKITNVPKELTNGDGTFQQEYRGTRLRSGNNRKASVPINHIEGPLMRMLKYNSSAMTLDKQPTDETYLRNDLNIRTNVSEALSDKVELTLEIPKLWTIPSVELPFNGVYCPRNIVVNQVIIDPSIWNNDTHIDPGDCSEIHQWRSNALPFYSLHVEAKSLADEQAGLSRKNDIDWKEICAHPKLKEGFTKAMDKEFHSLCETHGVLKRLFPGDEDYQTAIDTAIKGRCLADIKRDESLKVRAVKQGFRMQNEPGETYTGHVVSPISVRSALANHKEGNMIAIIDVSTAFLQSTKYPEGKVKYVKFKNPITGEMMYFKQFGPLYGEKSAPMEWEDTIAPFIESLGFTRAKNDSCIFFHKETGMIVLLYVDDLYLDGIPSDVMEFHRNLTARFECKELMILEEGRCLDYLGMEISKRHNNGVSEVSLTMAAYTRKLIEFLKVDSTHHSMNAVDCPHKDKMNTHDDDDVSLEYADRKVFMTGLGMLGWLVSCIRGDLAYTYSMIASDMANPTKLSMKRLIWATRYLKGTSTYGGVTKREMNTSTSQWRHFTDSDQGKNQSTENKGKARCGQISLANGMPVFYKSKATSVAMAHPSIMDGHADVSSAACEIYGAAQATFSILYLSYCADEMGIAFQRPSVLEMDNAAAEVFTNNTALNSKLRHIDQRQHWVQVLRDRNLIKAIHVDTKVNLADIFTKSIEGPTFRTLRDMFLHDCTDVCKQGGINILINHK